MSYLGILPAELLEQILMKSSFKGLITLSKVYPELNILDEEFIIRWFTKNLEYLHDILVTILEEDNVRLFKILISKYKYSQLVSIRETEKEEDAIYKIIELTVTKNSTEILKTIHEIGYRYFSNKFIYRFFHENPNFGRTMSMYMFLTLFYKYPRHGTYIFKGLAESEYLSLKFISNVTHGMDSTNISLLRRDLELVLENALRIGKIEVAKYLLSKFNLKLYNVNSRYILQHFEELITIIKSGKLPDINLAWNLISDPILSSQEIVELIDSLILMNVFTQSDFSSILSELNKSNLQNSNIIKRELVLKHSEPRFLLSIIISDEDSYDQALQKLQKLNLPSNLLVDYLITFSADYILSKKQDFAPIYTTSQFIERRILSDNLDDLENDLKVAMISYEYYSMILSSLRELNLNILKYMLQQIIQRDDVKLYRIALQALATLISPEISEQSNIGDFVNNL